MPRAFVALLGLASILVVLVGTPIPRAAAVLTVDTYEDTYDGSCAGIDCSLRDAVAAVDTGGTVRLPAGFYPLTLAGAGAVGAGDLDIDRPMTLVGIGETGSFLDTSALGDRAFDVTASAALHGLTMLGGSDVTNGGIVRVTAGRLRLSFTTMIDGRAVDGGAVAVGDGATLRIGRSWISGGRATGRGGALFVEGTAVVTRSTFSGNRADAGGGAWVGPDGSLTAADATLSSNEAARGGGAVRVHGELVLRSATAARNRAAVGGAAMASPGAAVTAAGSVFAGNEASVRGPTCSRTLTSLGHNVADAGACGLTAQGDLPGTDAKIGVLRQNGGPTPTHALRVGSPAVGNSARCSGLDQRGAPREDCDSGAYELVFCLGRPVSIVGTPGPDEFSGGLGRDVFLGRGGDDQFQGSLAADRACGGQGDDLLIGGPDDDRLAGSGGNDVLRGEAGSDLLMGGLGTDVCRGGSGRDLTRRCETVA